jgi:hypothetical protein
MHVYVSLALLIHIHKLTLNRDQTLPNTALGKPVVRCLAKHNNPEVKKKAQMRVQKACRRRFFWLKGQKS